MLLWLITLFTAALASPELDVERGRAAMVREAYDEARDFAISALRVDARHAEAQQLYIDATAAAGLGSRALRELASRAADTPPWRPLEAELAASLAEGDTKRARAVFRRLTKEFPEHPEVLATIWGLDSLRWRLATFRVQRRYLTRRAWADFDVVQLYRTRKLARAIERLDLVAGIDDVLRERGETPPPSREPLDRVGRTRYAERLVADEALELDGYPSELVDVADRAARLLFQGARHERAGALYRRVQERSGGPEAWAGEAEAWRLAGQLGRALDVANAALAHAVDPRPSDLGATNAELLRATLSRAFLVRAKIHEDSGDIAAAQNDLVLAYLLARRELDDRMTERMRAQRRALDVDLEARYRGRANPVRRALDAADTSDDADEIRRAVRDALLVISVGTRGGRRIARDSEAYEDRFALPMFLLSRAARKEGDVRLARSYASLATLLADEPDSFWFEELGELQRTLEELDAAFVSFAKARSRGVRSLEGRLAETYVGLGDWEVAADQWGAPPSDDAASVEASAAPEPSTVKTVPLTRPETVPQLGKPMPSFVIGTRSGRVDSSFLRGRIVVLSFFDRECDACLQMLPQFGTLARRLRARGMDTTVIAVSTDDDPTEFERMAHVGGHWGEVVHGPELARRFGVQRLPTTWLIDASGVARFTVDHWISGDELLDYIDQIK